jgi:triacylglycerol lipase
MPQFLQFLDLLPNGGGDGKAFQSLTPEAMSKFNEETPDAQDVQYFSFGASYNPGLIDTFKRVTVTSVMSHWLTLVPGGHMA